MAKATRKSEVGMRKPEDESADSPATMGLDEPTASVGLEQEVGSQKSEVESADLRPPTSDAPLPSTRPCCERHVVLMRAYSSTDEKTYYRCPVPGCDARETRVRVQVDIPSEPRACPQRTCRTPEGEPLAYLELVPQLSSLAQLHMACPVCRFNLKIPRPQFAEQVQNEARRRRGRAAESLDAR
jgi:hypothetical protein